MSETHKGMTPQQLALELDREIGEIAIRLGLLDAAQVKQALEARRTKPLDDEHDPGLVFVEEGLLTRAQLDHAETVRRFKSVRVAEKKFGELVVTRGWGSPEQVKAAMEVQKMLLLKENKEVTIGEMLVHQRTITAEQRDIILTVQHRAKQELQAQAAAVTEAPAPKAPKAAPAAPKVPVAEKAVETPAAPAPAPAPAPASASVQAAGPEPDAAGAQEVPITGRGTRPSAGFSVSTAPDHLAAFVTLLDAANRPDVEKLQVALRAANVVFGLDETALQQACEPDAPLNEALQIAAGEPAQPSRDAVIEYLFDLHPLKAGREGEDDSIDFRDRGDIPQVNEGDVLARKTPPFEGVPGKDVHGRAIKVRKPKDLRMNAGNGTQVGADGVTIVAAAAGHPAVTPSGVVSVYPEYRIDGDLGYNTGHVDFAGRVIVSGLVQQGFRVRCGELMAREIEGAEVDASGDVLIGGGVIGARIRSGGSVKAKYFHTSHVDALGDVLAQTEVVESDIETSGAFHGERCTVLASSISARKGVFAGEIGSPSSPPSHIVVGVDERVQHQVEQYEAEIAGLEQALAADAAQRTALEEQRDALEPRIAALAQVQDKALVRQRELERSLKAGDARAAQQLELLAEQTRSSEKEIEALFDEQDKAIAALDELERRKVQLQADMVARRADILQLREWSEGNGGVAELKVQKRTHQGTVVRGSRAEVTLNEDKNLLWLEEREVTSEQGETAWRLVPKSG